MSDDNNGDWNDENDITENNHGGESHSEGAHASIIESKAERKARIYAFINSRGARGATTDEVQIATGMLHQTVSARMSELKASDLIVPNGESRPTRTGRAAGVFITIEEDNCQKGRLF